MGVEVLVGIRAMDGNTVPKFSTPVFPGETEELTSEDCFYISWTHGPPSEPWVRKTCLVTDGAGQGVEAFAPTLNGCQACDKHITDLDAPVRCKTSLLCSEVAPTIMISVCGPHQW